MELVMPCLPGRFARVAFTLALFLSLGTGAVAQNEQGQGTVAAKRHVRAAVKRLAEANPNPDYGEAINAYWAVVARRGDAVYEIVRYAEGLDSSRASTQEREKRLTMLGPALANVLESCPGTLALLAEHSSGNVRYVALYAARCMTPVRTDVVEMLRADPDSLVRSLAAWP